MIKQFSEALVNALKNGLGIGYDILIYAVGAISIALSFISFQMKDRSRILRFNIFSSIGWTTFFVLNGDFTSALMNFIGICRVLVFLQRGKHAWAKSTAWLYIFLAFSLTGSVLTFKTWKDIFPLAGGLLNTIAFYVLNEKILRVLNLISYPMWMVNSLSKGFYIAFISDIAAFASLLLAIFRYNKSDSSKDKEQQPNATE